MQATASASTFTVTDPATGQAVGEVTALDRDGVLALVERARRAQPGWEALGFGGRGAVLRDLRTWLVDHRDRVLRTLISESGKSWLDAQLELFYVADALGFWAKRAQRYLADERARAHSPFLAGRKLVNRFRPCGVVGVIGPWNYPLINNFGDAVPALMAGNAVVLKPAQLTPLSSLLMEQGLREVGAPEGVFLVANGKGATVGGALVESVDMLHFTGSTEVGRKLGVQAAERLLPITLELGGNDPMIVLEDANLERAANAAVWGSLQNAGQTCISVERVYVESGAYEPFVARVVDKVRDVRQGGPVGPGRSDVGAMTSSEQLEILEEHVRDALDKDATLEAGGRRREGPGDFFEPTVLSGVDHSMKVMTEE
ncbi:MAG TPA: aldehyde dehydrogenase family protein, partial [Solirubrobacteraceae bacterium]|nr:aldehyde dehydrogenase family protein [Solirubrobacteraceae bacterium]